MERQEMVKCEKHTIIKHTIIKERPKPWILWRWVEGVATW